jgi:hypothetical protein
MESIDLMTLSDDFSDRKSHTTSSQVDEVIEETNDVIAESDDEDERDPDQNDSGSQNEPRQYRVKCITDKRTVAGKTEYSVRWIGYHTPTWEPADVISTDAPEAVKEFEAFTARRSEARVTRGTTRSQADIHLNDSKSSESGNSSNVMAARTAASRL